MCFMKPPKIETQVPPPPPPPLPEEVKGIQIGGSDSDDEPSGVESLTVKPKPFKKSKEKQKEAFKPKEAVSKANV